MPVARAQASNHVLDTLCEDGINDAFAGVIHASLANAGVASAQDIVALSHADLSTLQHAMLTTDNALANLSLGGKGMIVAIICMNMSSNNENGRGLTLDEWTAIQKEEFDVFHVSNLCTANRNLLMNPRSARPIPQTTASSTPGTRDKACNYKRAIKCDQSVFKEFKNEELWDSWNRGFIAQIKAPRPI